MRLTAALIGLRLIGLCLCAVTSAPGAEPDGKPAARLLVQDAQGNFLREAPVVPRSGGYAFTTRDAFYGAASGVLLDGQGGMHRVQWISADDPDLGVVEFFVGAQLPAGPAGSVDEKPDVLRAGGHDAKITSVKEIGSAGIIGRLDCRHELPESGPLFDRQGFLAGWHLVKEVDGRRISFAVPLRRLELSSHSVQVNVPDWGLRHDAKRESQYQRALGHFWAEDFDGALFYFRQAAEQDSSNARAWLHIGFAEGKQGRTREKVASLKRAIELDPRLAAAHYYLGLQFLMNGEHNDAEYELDELLRLESPYAARLEMLLRSVHVDRVEKGPKGNRPVHTSGRKLTEL